jgi:hypothetical protein
MRATNLLRIILLLSLLVIPAGVEQRLVSASCGCAATHWQAKPAGVLRPGQEQWTVPAAWHETMVPLGRIRQRHNPARNCQRWQRRYRRWLRQQPPVSRRQRRARQRAALQAMLGWSPPPGSTVPVRPVSADPTPSPAPQPTSPPRRPQRHPQTPWPLSARVGAGSTGCRKVSCGTSCAKSVGQVGYVALTVARRLPRAWRSSTGITAGACIATAAWCAPSLAIRVREAPSPT